MTTFARACNGTPGATATDGTLNRQRPLQCAKLLRPVAPVRRAVHTCERGGFGCGEFLEELSGVGRVGVVVHLAPHGLARREDIVLGKGDVFVTRLGEEVSPQKRVRVVVSYR